MRERCFQRFFLLFRHNIAFLSCITFLDLRDSFCVNYFLAWGVFCFLESNSLELNSCKKQTILYRKFFLTARAGNEKIVIPQIVLGFRTQELG